MIAIAVAVAGCATPYRMSERAAAIQVHQRASSLTDKCKDLGPVTATETDVAGGWEQARRRAQGAAREKVAALGGDTLLVLNYDDVTAGGMVQTIQGIALRCYK